jgi:ATP adenylyltransferase
MDHLWSPWRLQYVLSNKAETGCPFCEAPTLPEQQSLIVFSGRTCYVILNLYPYNNGHIMVVPYRHVATFALLTVEELQEIALLVQRSEMALNEAYRPQAMNVGVNLGRPAGGGIPEHLHVHLVPRWMGDSNFMTVVGNTRVLPEELSAGAQRLRPIFARLAQPE